MVVQYFSFDPKFWRSPLAHPCIALRSTGAFVCDVALGKTTART
jgi:hypothetical protein